MTTRSFNRKERRHTQADCGQDCATGTRGSAIAPPRYGVDLVDRGLSDNSSVLPTSRSRPEGVPVGSSGRVSGPSPYDVGVVDGKTEAAFDNHDVHKIPESDDDEVIEPEEAGPKQEVGISWEAPTIERGAGEETYETPVKHQNISWPSADYSSSGSRGSSTTVEKPIKTKYNVMDDSANNVLKLTVASITGGAKIKVNTGGSRNAISRPPTTEGDAQNAVTDMKGYYARGLAGKLAHRGRQQGPRALPLPRVEGELRPLLAGLQDRHRGPLQAATGPEFVRGRTQAHDHGEKAKERRE
jgi:hypothetical protein